MRQSKQKAKEKASYMKNTETRTNRIKATWRLQILISQENENCKSSLSPKG